MGIYSRAYMQEGRHYDGIPPAVKFILIANVVVFLLQIFILREVPISPLAQMRRWDPDLDRLLTEKEQEGPEALEKFRKEHPELDKYLKGSEGGLEALLRPTEKVSVIQEWFELDTEKVMQGQVWRLLTHAFCHDRYGVFHILFNMLFLYYFGCTLESMYGTREFILFYLTAAVVSALAFVGLDLKTGSTGPAIGASGAVMAVVMLYTMHFPYETIRIFWFFPIEMRWLMVFYVIWDLHPVLLALSGDRIHTGVAHAGHLGGLAFGFLYHHFQWRLENLFDRAPRRAAKEAWEPGPYRQRARATLRLYHEPQPDAEMDRVDEILKKITDSGRDSLSDEERETLRQASERIKNRSNGDA